MTWKLTRRRSWNCRSEMYLRWNLIFEWNWIICPFQFSSGNDGDCSRSGGHTRLLTHSMGSLGSVQRLLVSRVPRDNIVLSPMMGWHWFHRSSWMLRSTLRGEKLTLSTMADFFLPFLFFCLFRILSFFTLSDCAIRATILVWGQPAVVEFLSGNARRSWLGNFLAFFFFFCLLLLVTSSTTEKTTESQMRSEKKNMNVIEFDTTLKFGHNQITNKPSDELRIFFHSFLCWLVGSLFFFGDEWWEMSRQQTANLHHHGEICEINGYLSR